MVVKRVTGRLEWTVAVVAATLFLAAIGYFLYNPRSGGMRAEEAVGELARKGRLVDEMRFLLAKSSQDERTSVLADDDERSEKFAVLARADMNDLDKVRAELDTLVAAAGEEQEIKLARQFGENWQEFRAISEKLLELSLLNSSVKAFEVSRTRAAPALDAFVGDLDSLMDKAAGPQAAQIIRMGARAQVAAERIMVLHAPHINEEDDAPMDAMESEINSLASSAKSDLAGLGPLGADRDGLAKAGADFDAFMGATAEVVRLSRLNSRYQAMALIFGAKRRAEGLCEDALTALRGHLQNKAYKATR